MSNSVAVVIPVYKPPDESDLVSVRHLDHFLGKYRKIFIGTSEALQYFGNHQTKDFDNKYFSSISAYSDLLLSKHFYQAFREFEYILIYQLDCLVFSDDLETWCEKGYDYIGAPWFWSKESPESGVSRVGNGGFSLRKVQSFLKVLESSRQPVTPLQFILDFFRINTPDLMQLSWADRVKKKFRVLREASQGVEWYTNNYAINEDRFWSDRAKLFYPEFSIPSVRTALSFAFESFPEFCYEKNGKQLPFGCHAWAKWGRTFWEPFLLTKENL